MEFRKQRDATDTTRSFARANLLWTCYGETGVIDFGLNRTCCWGQYWKKGSDYSS